MVEIAKALSFNSRVLIMDEPTAALNNAEIAELFKMIRELKARGVGIIYISHKMDELKQIADRVTVLRDGEYVGHRRRPPSTSDRDDHRHDGRAHPERRAPRRRRARRAISRSRSATSNCGPLVRDVSFSLRKGEILGFAGLMGAGRTEVARAMFGADPLAVGRDLRAKAAKVSIRTPSTPSPHGIGYLSEDRKRFGLATGMDVESNVVMSNLREISVDDLLPAGSARSATPRGRLHQASEHPHAVADAGGAAALGRQPAEDRHRQVARSRLRHPVLRRADARHRRRRQERNLQAAAIARRPGQGDRHDLLGAAGDPAHERPYRRDVRRPHHRRAVAASRRRRSASCNWRRSAKPRRRREHDGQSGDWRTKDRRSRRPTTA